MLYTSSNTCQKSKDQTFNIMLKFPNMLYDIPIRYTHLKRLEWMRFKHDIEKVKHNIY